MNVELKDFKLCLRTNFKLVSFRQQCFEFIGDEFFGTVAGVDFEIVKLSKIAKVFTNSDTGDLFSFSKLTRESLFEEVVSLGHAKRAALIKTDNHTGPVTPGNE